MVPIVLGLLVVSGAYVATGGMLILAPIVGSAAALLIGCFIAINNEDDDEG